MQRIKNEVHVYSQQLQNTADLKNNFIHPQVKSEKSKTKLKDVKITTYGKTQTGHYFTLGTVCGLIRFDGGFGYSLFKCLKFSSSTFNNADRHKAASQKYFSLPDIKSVYKSVNEYIFLYRKYIQYIHISLYL